MKGQLGGPIIIHNYPLHALRLPLAWTILVPLEGDSARLRSHLDNLLKDLAEEYGGMAPAKLYCDADGIWSIRFGIDGPALAVTDHWLILSFSPEAVRKNIAICAPPAAAASRTASDR